MRKVKDKLVHFAKDDQGGEALEYALVAGFIVLVAIAGLTVLSPKVKGTWDKLGTDFPAAP